MAISIKKQVFGSWAYYDGVRKGVLHTRKENPVDLSKVQSMSLQAVEELHARTINKNKLTEKIDAIFDKYLNSTTGFSQSDYIKMLAEAFNSRVIVNEKTAAQTDKGMLDLMEPDELANYLSTFMKKISNHFSEKSLATQNLYEKVYLGNLSNRFYEVTAATVILFQRKLFEGQLEELKQYLADKSETYDKTSAKHKELELKIASLEEELERIKPEVIKAEGLLLSTLTETEKKLFNAASDHHTKSIELMAEIDKYKQKIAELDPSIAENSIKLKLYQQEKLKLENELAKLQAQAKGFEEPGPTP